MRPGAKTIAVFVAGLLSLGAADSRAVGPFKDVSDLSDFIRAPRDHGLSGSITRADSQGRGASIFTLAGFYPLRTSFLMQLECSYVALADDEVVLQDLGDVFLRLKARVWGGNQSALALISNVRLGTGTPTLFPYSTASTDVELGISFVDSLGRDAAGDPRFFSYWAMASGTYVFRVNDRLEADELHGNCVSAGGGVLAGLTRRLGVEAGGLGLAFDSGALREIYYARISAALSPATRLHVIVQGERGDWQDRAVDASAEIGLIVLY